MNVSRVYRLLKLITLLRSGRQCDVEYLRKEAGVSRRTVFRDLKMLELAGVPYHFDHNEQAYAIPDSFFLPPLHLDLQEALALLLVTRKMLTRQVHPMHRQAVNATLKIESNLPSVVLDHCGKWLDGLKEISAWVLGYGDQVEVRSPPGLRKIIHHKAARMVRLATPIDLREEDRASCDPKSQPSLCDGPGQCSRPD